VIEVDDYGHTPYQQIQDHLPIPINKAEFGLNFAASIIDHIKDSPMKKTL
jgi:hypothetical protein